MENESFFQRHKRVLRILLIVAIIVIVAFLTTVTFGIVLGIIIFIIMKRREQAKKLKSNYYEEIEEVTDTENIIKNMDPNIQLNTNYLIIYEKPSDIEILSNGIEDEKIVYIRYEDIVNVNSSVQVDLLTLKLHKNEKNIVHIISNVNNKHLKDHIENMKEFLGGSYEILYDFKYVKT